LGEHASDILRLLSPVFSPPAQLAGASADNVL
jgi:hypothetical protein